MAHREHALIAVDHVAAQERARTRMYGPGHAPRQQAFAHGQPAVLSHHVQGTLSRPASYRSNQSTSQHSMSAGPHPSAATQFLQSALPPSSAAAPASTAGQASSGQATSGMEFSTVAATVIHKHHVEEEPAYEKPGTSVMEELPDREDEGPVYAEWSFYVFSIDNPIRKAFLNIVNHKWFSTLMALIVITNVGFLCSDDPLTGDSSDRNQIVEITELAFLIVYSAEMAMKCLAYGVFGARDAYVGNPWNVLDTCIMGVGWFALFYGPTQPQVRTLRAVRPLRIINVVGGIKILVESLLSSFPLLVDVAFLILFFFVIYGIIGVQTFSGELQGRCLPEASDDPDRVCSLNGQGRPCPEGQSCQRVENPHYGLTNYDNFGWASLTVFQCISMEGWTEIMYMTMDAVNSWSWLYYVSLIFFASFFAVQLALAVISDTFSRRREEREAKEEEEKLRAAHELQAKLGKMVLAGGVGALLVGTRDFNPNQKANSNQGNGGAAVALASGASVNADNGLVAGSSKSFLLSRFRSESFQDHDLRRAPDNPLRYLIYKLVTWSWFDHFMVACIVANSAILASEHYGQTNEEQQTQDISNFVFTMVFVAELLLKIIGLGPFLYFSDKMNRFDCAVTLISVGELFAIGTGAFVVLRTFRLLRLFKLARSWPSLKRLLVQIYRSLKSVMFFTFFFVFFMIMYVLIGMQLYGGKYLPLQEDGEVPRANFDTFLYGFTTVFQILTGENWNEIMYETIRSTSWGSAFFFVTLLIFGVYVLLNLFVAILLDNFKDDDSDDLVDDAEDTQQSEEQPESTVFLPGSLSSGGSFASKGEESKLDRRSDRKRSQLMEIAKKQNGDAEEKPKKRKTASADLWDAQATESPSPDTVPATTGPMRRRAASRSGSPPLLPESLLKASTSQSQLPAEPATEADVPADQEVAPSNGESAPAPAQETTTKKKKKKRVQQLSGHSGAEASVDGSSVASPGPLTVTAVGASFDPEGSGFAGEVGTDEQFRPVSDGRVFGIKSSAHTSKPAVLARHGSSKTLDSVLANSQARRRDSFDNSEPQVVNPSKRMSIAGPAPAAPGASASASGKTASNSNNAQGGQASSIPALYGDSLWLMSPTNKFRVSLAHVVYSRFFDPIMLVVILLSCIALALEGPQVTSDSDLGQALRILEYFFIAVFIVEAVLKILVRGFLLHRGAYLHSAWNVLDFLIVLAGITALILDEAGGPFYVLRVFRLVRILRPLKSFSRFPSMRLVVTALLRAVPGMVNVCIIAFLLYMMFAIMGVQFFKGTFFSCNDNTVSRQSACTGECAADSSCAGETREWNNAPYNFDNVANGFVALFTVATLEGWVTIMRSAIDSTGIGEQPRRNNNPTWALWFIVFIIFGGFFVINLFTGVLVEQFQKLREEEDSGVLMTEEQRQWVDLQRQIVRETPRIRAECPTTQPRKLVFTIVTSRIFEIVIIGIICINVVIMATQYYGQPDSWTQFLYISNIVFVAIFALEALLKIYALSLRMYVRDGWNRLDLTIIVTSLIGIFLDTGIAAAFFRVFRVLRIFKIVKHARSLRALLRTLYYSLPSLVNVGSLLFVLFYMYAVIGVSLYGKVKPKKPYAMNHIANFETWPNAMLLLFRMTTGESWSAIMWDCQVQSPDCDESKDECGTPYAPIYFMTFMVLGTFILIQLFIAVILENFEATMDQNEGKLTPDDLQEFTDLWSRFDPKATLCIKSSVLPQLLYGCSQPLGIGAKGTRKDLSRRLLQLEIPEHDGYIQFHETLHAMAMNVFDLKYSKIMAVPAEVLFFGFANPRDYMHEMSVVRRRSAWIAVPWLDIARKQMEDAAAAATTSLSPAATSHGLNPTASRTSSNVPFPSDISLPEKPQKQLLVLSDQLRRQRHLQQMAQMQNMTTRQLYAAILMQSAYRSYVAQKELRAMKEVKRRDIEQHRRMLIDSHIRSLIAPSQALLLHPPAQPRFEESPALHSSSHSNSMMSSSPLRPSTGSPPTQQSRPQLPELLITGATPQQPIPRRLAPLQLPGNSTSQHMSRSISPSHSNMSRVSPSNSNKSHQ